MAKDENKHRILLSMILYCKAVTERIKEEQKLWKKQQQQQQNNGNISYFYDCDYNKFNSPVIWRIIRNPKML